MGIENKTVQVAQAEVMTEEQCIQLASDALSKCNWTIGQCASVWTQKYSRGRTDEDFGKHVGLSGEQVRQRRAVWDYYNDVYQEYPRLSWSHFYAAKNWDDSAELLQWAQEQQATVGEMLAYRRAVRGISNTVLETRNTPHAGTSIASNDQDAESGECETRHAIASEGKGSGFGTYALEERTENPVSASAPVSNHQAVSGDSHGEDDGQQERQLRPSILKVTPETTQRKDTTHAGQVYQPVAQATKPQEPIEPAREADIKHLWTVFESRAKAIEDDVQKKALAGVMRVTADLLDPPQETFDPDDTEPIKPTSTHISKAVELYTKYPKKVDRDKAIIAIKKALKREKYDVLLEAVSDYRKRHDELHSKGRIDKSKIPHCATWFNGGRWADDRDEWFTHATIDSAGNGKLAGGSGSFQRTDAGRFRDDSFNDQIRRRKEELGRDSQAVSDPFVSAGSDDESTPF